MRILVLGGTGAIGSHLVDLLTIDGINVVVTSRSRDGVEGNARYAHGNAQDVLFLKQLLREQWDAIVDFMTYSTPAFAARINLLLASARQYVFLSTARVYANSSKPIVEDSPRLLDVLMDTAYLSTDEYALSKARQEDMLQRSELKHWTIVRPYITYSEQRLQLGPLEKEQWLFRALRGRTIVFCKDIRSKITALTYGLDVARGIRTLIGNPHALGQSFNVTGAESIRWNEVLDVYLDVLEGYLGARPKVQFQDLHDFCYWWPSKYQLFYDRLYDRAFDSSKIRYLGMGDFVSVKVGLKNCLEAFLTNPSFREIDGTSEALRDIATNERTAICEIPSIKERLKYFVRRNAPIKYHGRS